MKKRKCKMTEAEKAIHDRAVKIKRMTDAQICDFIDSTYSKGVEDGKKSIIIPTKQRPDDEAYQVKEFIKYLEGRIGSGNRIGLGTILQLNRELEKAIKGGLFDKKVAI